MHCRGLYEKYWSVTNDQDLMQGVYDKYFTSRFVHVLPGGKDVAARAAHSPRQARSAVLARAGPRRRLINRIERSSREQADRR